MNDQATAGEASTTGRRRVPPRHCDAQGMMHASRPAEYFEDAFLAWLDVRLGGHDTLLSGGADLVLVNTNITYRRAIRLGQEINATAEIVGSGRTSLTMRLTLASNDVVHVEADHTYVCVSASGPTELPERLRFDSSVSAPDLSK